MITEITDALVDAGNIEVLGARVHNLKNIDVSIPKNKLVVITGISGSGKSSLAFDTIFAEGQRRYMESFAAYARQFMGDLDRPDVDKITGLSPVISIEQKTTNRNPRSTVGTVTEVYDFMRLLYARVAEAFSYNTGKKMAKFSEEEIVAHLQQNFSGKKIMLLTPIVRGRKGHYRELFEQLRKQGYLKVRIDGEVTDLKERMQLDRYKIHDIELVVDRLLVPKDGSNSEAQVRLSQSIQKSLQMGKDLMFVADVDKNTISQYSKTLMCLDTGISYEEPSPNTFSFNSPYGACPKCKGLGSIYQVNMAEVLPDMTKSITDGGIAPLGGERDAWAFQMATVLAKKNKIPLNIPIKDIPQKQLNILLYGNEEGVITYTNDEAETYHEVVVQHNYEGIINMVLRWFNETTSEGVRQWAEKFMVLNSCPVCNGARLKKESLFFRLDNKNISELSAMSLQELMDWFTGIEGRLNNKQNQIAKDILKEIRDRLHFLLDVGLHYLTTDRPTRTLSGGESQRIRLATQIGSQLTGITYILDEPSIGLHQRDNQRLIKALKNLRDGGNSVLVVEHDKDIMLASDHLIDIGPAAGLHGGRIVSAGTPAQILLENTTTSRYLNHTLQIEVPAERRKGNGKSLVLEGATGNNLKNVSIKLPLGTFICVSGVSGSGKSTLINETLYPILGKQCYHNFRQMPMPYKKVQGLEHIDKVIEIDQSPIGRTPRSNPATYCGFFNEVRQLFSQVPEAKIRGYTAGRFSFNVKSGRCEECQGGGMRVIEMNFLPDVYVQCEKCNGRRYNRETLEIRYKGKSISDVLNMTVDEAVEFFVNVPYLHRKIKTLQDVGLGYVTLGQSAVTLSGGEAQRVKLATELSKRDTGQTIYILDEPTTGLHFEDIKHLLSVLNRLVDRGNTVLVIEHNMDVIKVADYVIDMGPEGGGGGGKVVGEGTPEDIAKIKASFTGMFLKQELIAGKELSRQRLKFEFMKGYHFSKYDPNEESKAPFDKLLDVFTELLSYTNGDAGEALNWLTQLDKEYKLTGKDYGIGDFIEDLKEHGYIKENGQDGTFKITPKTEQSIRKRSLEEIFGKMKKAKQGSHRTFKNGQGDEPNPETRPYEFGDAPETIDYTGSLKNAFINHGIESLSMHQDDLEIHETDFKSQTSTVLMIDISHSMILYGEDRITPAKKVAMALSELITTRYPKDTLDIVVFGNDAWQIEMKDLPYLEVGPYHTNTVAGLELAMELLRRRKNPNKQIFMITDGKPTCLKIGNKYYKNSFGIDSKILNRTLNLAGQLRRMKIPVITFMIAQDPYLQKFVREFTEVNNGKAFYSSLDGLGNYIFEDYERNKRKTVR